VDISRNNADDLALLTTGEVMALLLATPGVPLGRADRFRLGVAGAEATVAVALARLGHRAAYAGRVGADHLGRQVVRTLRGEGVEVSALRPVAGGATGLLVRDAVVDRPLSVEYHRRDSAASLLTPEDLADDLVARCRVLHLTGITAVLSASAREAVADAAVRARAHGALVVLDPNVRLKLAPARRWSEVLNDLAGLCDVVLTGDDDARSLTDGPPADWFLERGARTVVTKGGADGAVETDGTRWWHQSARATRVVDPVGAGDAFAAGWIDGWLRGLDPAERLRSACAVASLAVGAPGDLDGLPDRALLEQVLGVHGDVDR